MLVCRRQESGEKRSHGKNVQDTQEIRGCRSPTRLSRRSDIAGTDVLSCEKEIETLYNDPVALTRGFFETRPIDDGNLAALVADQSGVLKSAGSHCDASARSA